MLIEDWRHDYNHRRPHSALGMMTPAAFAAGLRQPLPAPTATAAGEGGEQRCLLPSRAAPHSRPLPNRANDRVLLRRSPHLHTNRRGSYRGTTHHNHPALTAGGPMNGLRSGERAERRLLLTQPGDDPPPPSSRPGQRQSPAGDHPTTCSGQQPQQVLWRQHYTHPALKAGGPMNGVWSIGLIHASWRLCSRQSIAELSRNGALGSDPAKAEVICRLGSRASGASTRR